MTNDATPYVSACLADDGSLSFVPDPDGAFVSREEYDSLLKLLKKARLHADNNEGMAECMSMFRQAMIEAGIVGETCPPMFMAEGVGSYIYNLSQQVARSRM